MITNTLKAFPLKCKSAIVLERPKVLNIFTVIIFIFFNLHLSSAQPTYIQFDFQFIIQLFSYFIIQHCKLRETLIFEKPYYSSCSLYKYVIFHETLSKRKWEVKTKILQTLRGAETFQFLFTDRFVNASFANVGPA